MSSRKAILGVLRISLGWIFLWAFIDKLFGLNSTTTPDQSWIAGASPTFGFLKLGTTGPLAGVYQSIAGSAAVDWLFMLGLLGVGVALIFGIAVRLAAVSGISMMLLMYTAALPPAHNPIVDEHIIYALVLATFFYLPVGNWWGLGRKWSSLSLVKKLPWLK